MYHDGMPRRTQITLTEEQYARMLALSEETGVSMSELIRRALDRTYAARGEAALEESFGAWRGRSLDGEAYVDGMRRGMAERDRTHGRTG